MVATIPPANASTIHIATKVPPAIAPTTAHMIKTYPEILLFAPIAIAPKTIVKKEKTIPSIPNVPISVDALWPESETLSIPATNPPANKVIIAAMKPKIPAINAIIPPAFCINSSFLNLILVVSKLILTSFKIIET